MERDRDLIEICLVATITVIHYAASISIEDFTAIIFLYFIVNESFNISLRIFSACVRVEKEIIKLIVL